MGECEKPRGRIMREYWVGCGLCYEHEALADLRSMTPIENAKQLGWKYTKARGWVCPVCQGKAPAHPRGLGVRAAPRPASRPARE